MAKKGLTTNKYDLTETAGAFGDLGTLVPFVAAYIGVLKMDPLGVLLAFGVSMIVCGLHYRTPLPVQPMKAAGAIATTQAAQTLTITPGMVWGAGLATGLIWLFLALTGTARRMGEVVARPVMTGIILGLGFGFMINGAKMMAQNWWVGGVALLGAVLLLRNRVVPAMFLLLLFGATVGLVSDPALLDALSQVRPAFRLPDFALSRISLPDFLTGAAFLALPQVPLTLGNAILAVTEENNRLFPDRPVNETKIAASTGSMNLFSASVGGVPMCHGAGGMAGHVQFGARTGGSLVILGSILLVLALVFSNSVAVLFRLFPPCILGVILFLTGAQLALGVGEIGREKGERFVIMITAALAIWNVGIAFIIGVIAHWMDKREFLRL